MKKKLLLFALITIFIMPLSAQVTNQQAKTPQAKPTPHKNNNRLRNFKMSMTGGYFQVNDYSVGMGGVSMEFFVGRHMSLNYNFNLGVTANSGSHFYYHGPIGASTGSVLLIGAALNNAIDDGVDDAFSKAFGTDFNVSKNITGGLALTGIILLVIPEGFNYNIDIGKNISISPYINPLGFDFCASNIPFGHRLNLTWEYGSKVNFYFNNKRFLSPKVGIKNFYANGRKGLELGLMYGFYL
ncbi:MAG: hypothetical protein K9J13_06830 [Saprospiraceae bacterium]|nr:hypothetical protein [Saprospiraceae bacterium]